MKAAKLVLLGTLTIGITGTVHAALTGSITLQGSVGAATAIVVTPQNNYNALDLATTVSNLNVANVREINNTAAGYKVTLVSANAGKLKNGTLGQVSYTAKYNGNAVTLSASPQQITNQGPQTGVVNVVKAFTINYTGTPAADLMVGTYSDTLTFTIAAN